MPKSFSKNHFTPKQTEHKGRLGIFPLKTPSDRIWPSGRIPAIWPESRIPADWPDLAREAGSRPAGPIWPERPAGRTDLARSGHFRLNPAIPDSDETVRILAFISNSGYISRNQVKMVRILSVSDRISSSMIFILFYINIFML